MSDPTYRELVGTAGITALWRKQQQQAETALVDAVSRFFDWQLKSTIQELDRETDASIGSISPEMLTGRIFDPAEWTDDLPATMRPYIFQAAESGALAEIAMEHTEKAGRLQRLPRRVRDEIDLFLTTLFVAPYWYSIQETTQKELTKTLTTALATSATVAGVAKLLRGKMGGERAITRATEIAEVESAGALNAGHVMGMEELGRRGHAMQKQWFTRGDDRVRASHAALDGAVVNVGEYFDVGGEMAPYPAYHMLSPAQKCNCRCGIRSVPATENYRRPVAA